MSRVQHLGFFKLRNQAEITLTQEKNRFTVYLFPTTGDDHCLIDTKDWNKAHACYTGWKACA